MGRRRMRCSDVVVRDRAVSPIAASRDIVFVLRKSGQTSQSNRNFDDNRVLISWRLPLPPAVWRSITLSINPGSGRKSPRPRSSFREFTLRHSIIIRPVLHSPCTLISHDQLDDDGAQLRPTAGARGRPRRQMPYAHEVRAPRRHIRPGGATGDGQHHFYVEREQCFSLGALQRHRTLSNMLPRRTSPERNYISNFSLSCLYLYAL